MRGVYMTDEQIIKMLSTHLEILLGVGIICYLILVIEFIIEFKKNGKKQLDKIIISRIVIFLVITIALTSQIVPLYSDIHNSRIIKIDTTVDSKYHRLLLSSGNVYIKDSVGNDVVLSAVFTNELPERGFGTVVYTEKSKLFIDFIPKNL